MISEWNVEIIKSSFGMGATCLVNSVGIIFTR